MSEMARTYLAQAQGAIAAGDPQRALDLLMKARLVAGPDPLLRKAILEAMNGVSAQTRSTEEQRRAWAAQLDEVRRATAPPPSQFDVEQHPADRQKVMRGRLIGGSVGTAALVAVVLWAMWPQESIQEHLNSAASSVYAVTLQDANGQLDPFGTAWTVWRNPEGARGLLATNAHVAESVDQFLAIRTLGRSSSKLGRDVTEQELMAVGAPDREALRITGTVIHPGWKRWSAIFSKPLPSRRGDWINLIPIFDIALLQVEGDVGVPLQIASDDELQSLRKGDAVGYVGFPVENMTGVRARRDATVQIGNLTTLADPFVEATTDYNSRVLLGYDMNTTGGASGSPLINSHGRVIGVVSAGDTVSTLGGRVPLGFNFAQRADFVRDLLRDQADSIQARFDRQIQAQLPVRIKSPTEWADDLSADGWTAFLRSRQVRSQNSRERGTRADPNETSYTKLSEEAAELEQPPKTATFLYPTNTLAQPGESFLFVAVASDFSGIELSISSAGSPVADLRPEVFGLRPDALPSWLALGHCKAASPSRFEIDVVAMSQTNTVLPTVKLIVFQMSYPSPF